MIRYNLDVDFKTRSIFNCGYNTSYEVLVFKNFNWTHLLMCMPIETGLYFKIWRIRFKITKFRADFEKVCHYF